MSNQSNQIVPPVVCKPIVKGQQCFQMLEPLAAVTEQDATPFQGPWIPVQPGSALQLTLEVAALSGTLFVHLETVGDVTDPPRILGAFRAMNEVGSVDMLAVSDAFVRVLATPGTGEGQTASWRVRGKGYVPYAPAT
jgi:hypothetical protein